MKELLELIARSLVDNPDQVVVTEIDADESTVLELRVAADDLGKVIGKSVARAEVPDVIENLIGTYLDRRDSDDERFVDVVHRLGVAPFKERVYGAH